MSDARPSLAASLRTDALTRPISKADADRILADVPTDGEIRRRSRVPLRDLPLGSRIFLILLNVFIAVVCGLIGLALVFGIIDFFQDAGANPWMLLSPAGLGIGALLLFFAFTLLPRRQQRIRQARMKQLSDDNGWIYTPFQQGFGYPGTFFTQGSRRELHDLVVVRKRPELELGELSYEIQAGKSTIRYRYGFVAMRLPQRLPHIVLDSVRNGSRGGRLPIAAALAPEQRLSLEGNFDDTFHLYCPPGYEQDALYLFSPDIMALFLDHAAALDVEIVDGWIFMYGNPQDVTDPTAERWRSTLAIVDALDTKIAQWDRWRDERKKVHARKGTPRFLARPRPDVAPAGARLHLPTPAQVRRNKVRSATIGLGVAIMLSAALWGARSFFGF